MKKLLALPTMLGVSVWVLASCQVSESGVTVLPQIAESLPGILQALFLLLAGSVLKGLGVDLGQGFGIGF